MGRRDRRRGGAKADEPRRKRRRIRELEEPGSVLKGPRITVSCECGQTRYLAHGERWRCESCGRSYDTSRIPREQYEDIRQISLRFRVLPIAFGSMVAVLAILFTLTGNIPGVFFLLPVALVTWFVFLRPFHRKRYREAIKGLPVWQLRAD